MNTADLEAELVVRAPETSEARAVLAKGSKSFSFAGWFLPDEQRDDAALLYAFCRYVDDVADEALDPFQARAGLDAVEAELLGQVPPSPFLRDVLTMFEMRRINRRHAVELVHGVASDLSEVRVADDRELIRYCYRVASTVGLMMCGVLGVHDPRALPYAIDLGVGMQLTNICRDVAEDARNDRVYLPAARLERWGVEPTPRGVLASPEGISRVVADLLDHADRYYASARSGMRFIPLRARLAILVASRVYRAIGVRLRANGCDALAGRTIVPTSSKLVEAAGAIGGSFFLPREPHRSDLHRFLDGLPGANLPHGEIA